jgi:hypothetical protein
MSFPRTLTAFALSTLFAPSALAQDAALLAAAQDSMDTAYIVGLERTWSTMTRYEPALEALDLSWDEQLDVVEELADTGVADTALGSFTMDDFDLEGVLFTELYGVLNPVHADALGVRDWIAEGFFPCARSAASRPAGTPGCRWSCSRPSRPRSRW